jgi:hypothetical protein
MSDSPRSDYAKFNGINFPQWKFGVMLKLRRKKLDSIVLGIETKPNEVRIKGKHCCWYFKKHL